MNKIKNCLLLFVAVGLAFLLLSGKTEAKSFTGATVSPTSYRPLCDGGTPVDFAAYPSNVNFNTTTGKATYNINVKWKRCPGSAESRAYAVYASPEICPRTGYYGVNGNDAHDCVKYIGDPEFEGASGLTCSGGRTNNQCIDPNFVGAKRSADQPTTVGESFRVPMSSTYSGWSSAPDNGTWPITSQMCQYYKPGPSFSSHVTQSRCITIAINISWATIPNYRGTCDVLNVPTSVQAGGTFGVQFRVDNTGTRAWDRRFVKLASAGDSNAWGRTRVTIPNGTGTINSGGSQTFATASNYFTAPTFPQDEVTVVWRVIQERTGDPVIDADFPGTVDNIARCSATIRVHENRNYPYVRGTTNDIWTGALFSPNKTGQCTAYTPALLDAAASAQAEVNNLNSLAVLNGAKPGFERAAVYVARMYKAILGPNRAYEVTGGSYWIDQYVTGARDEPAMVDAFLNTAEAQARMNGTSNQVFVQRLYEGLFERTPQVSEIQFWIDALGSGWSRGRVSRAIIYYADNGPFGMNANNNFGGSGSDYGAFATGENRVNQNDIGGLLGGNGIRASGQTDIFDLTFANRDIPTNQNYGGFSESGQCLENYFLKYDDMPKQVISGTSAEMNTNITAALNNATGSSIIRRNGGSGTLTLTGAVTMQTGADVVLLVDGNVSINNNITYSSAYGTTTQPAAPRLVIIARGTITIARGVTQLDGVYIAQPRVQSCTANGSTCTNVVDTGIIQTCLAAEHSNTAYQFAGSRCGENQLKVNGSLIAQKLRLYRRYGSIGATFDTDRGNLASLQCAALKNFWATNPDSYITLYSTKAPGTVNQCAGEWVDAHPERYFSGSSNDPTLGAQSYQELPPIY